MICPRCKGNKQLVAYEIKNGKKTGAGEMLPCPTCHATGEATQKDIDDHRKFTAVCSPNCTCGRDSLPVPIENLDTGNVDYICRRCGKKAGITRRIRA